MIKWFYNVFAQIDFAHMVILKLAQIAFAQIDFVQVVGNRVVVYVRKLDDIFSGSGHNFDPLSSLARDLEDMKLLHLSIPATFYSINFLSYHSWCSLAGCLSKTKYSCTKLFSFSNKLLLFTISMYIKQRDLMELRSKIYY